ncbi:MAG TPA: hypothetical protein VD996_07845 [Chitinophagaceae bacterium]|nr:hypothetical protein [Chitinophagaceae bacterium]
MKKAPIKSRIDAFVLRSACSGCLLMISLLSISQTLELQKSEDTIYVEKGKTGTKSFVIKCVGCKNDEVLVANVEPHEGAFPQKYYKTGPIAEKIKISSEPVPVHIDVTAAEEKDYGKAIVFRVTDLSDKSEKSLYYFLYVMRPPVAVDSNQYRLMIGTNFDFIDGITPKSVYYHLQFFTPSAFSRRFGFVGGIQQNRQVSQRDTAFNEIVRNQGKVFVDSVRLSNHTPLGSDSFRIHRLDSVNFRQISTATVFQIYFQPTFKIYKLRSPKAQTDIYVFAHADLNYRRTKYEDSYTFKIRDSLVVGRASFSKYTAVNATARTVTVDNYEYYYGAGIMIHHENKYVDLYAKFMFGGANLSKGRWNGYYASEVGIRIPGINVMIGSEYRGLYNQHNPSYLNVHLSKVVSLNKLFDFLIK